MSDPAAREADMGRTMRTLLGAGMLTLLLAGPSVAGPPGFPPRPDFGADRPPLPAPPGAREDRPPRPAAPRERPSDWRLRGGHVEGRAESLDREFERRLPPPENPRPRAERGRVHVYYDDSRPYWYDPYAYAWYSCPPGQVTVVQGRAGTRITRCRTTPMIRTVVVVADPATVQPRKARVTSSPVVAYAVSSVLVVYSTSFEPGDVYWERVGERYFWVPGAAAGTPETVEAIQRADRMPGPTGNAVVISYEIGDRRVYLTDAPPLPGIHRVEQDGLHAWIAGVAEPSDSEREALSAALRTHADTGAAALQQEVSGGRTP